MKLERFSNGRYSGWVEPDLSLPSALLSDPWREAQQLPGAKVLLDCEGRKILRVELARAQKPFPCFVYIFRNHSYARSFRPTYAFHILRKSEELRRAGFSTMEVVAAFRPKWQMLNWWSFLIAGELQSVCELPSRGNHVYKLHEWADFDRSMASLLGRRLAEFHDQRFVHGDLKTRHILTRHNGTRAEVSGPREILLVDLEKTKRLPRLLGPVHDIFAARDLVQLLASLPEEEDGRSLALVREHLIQSYFEQRQISKKAISRIRSVLNLYGPGGALRQGRTVLGTLIRRLGSH